MTNVLISVATAVFGTMLATAVAQQPVTPGQPTPGVQPGMPAPGTTPMRTPPRAARPGEDPQKGTAVLRGYVIAADTGAPLRRAMVRATAQDGRGGGMTTTDADGRFEIKELAGGRYSISASKAGYVMMQYGQRRPEQQGTMLEVVDGQMVDKIAFSLPRGGVITGRVTDEFGDPVAGAQVNALRYRYLNGGRRLMPAGNAMTDDQGAFRMFGLVPGEYYVSGSLRMQNMMGPPTVVSTGMEGFAPTYYPGTPNVAEAQRIAVKVGNETAGVVFSLTATRLARVSGRAVTSTGEPVVQGFVNAVLADRSGPAMMMGGFNGAMTRADGSFQFPGLPAGTYNLMLRPRGQPGPTSEFGQVRITIGSDDLENVLIVASGGAIVRGVIMTDDDTALPIRPQQVNLFVQPSDADEMMMMGSGNPRVNDDWTFELTGLANKGRIVASLAESPEWSFKGVYLNGQDVTDTPLEFVPGQTIDGVALVFSRRRTELSGSIADDRGRPETDATVIIFAEDSSRWTFQSRYIRTARPNQDGRYNLRGMPPHDYYIVAVRTVEMGQWQDPEFLEGIREQATRVSLGEGETKVHDLKLAKQ